MSSWLGEVWDNFSVGVAGGVDYVFDTSFAAEIDANLAQQEQGLSDNQANERSERNVEVEQEIIPEAWKRTETQIADAASKGLWAFGTIATVALVVGAALGIVYLVKTAKVT